MTTVKPADVDALVKEMEDNQNLESKVMKALLGENIDVVFISINKDTLAFENFNIQYDSFASTLRLSELLSEFNKYNYLDHMRKMNITSAFLSDQKIIDTIDFLFDAKLYENSFTAKIRFKQSSLLFNNVKEVCKSLKHKKDIDIDTYVDKYKKMFKTKDILFKDIFIEVTYI